ncbi:hypothetical protein TNCV_4537511 [Trichonephila clavipes]|nr:hypothetical protein TNCV_4537511 [Trichonephila clavipes]
MDATKVNIPSNIDLADKDFGIPGEIDMLIGLLFSGVTPCYMLTVFGYIAVGSFDKFEEKSYCGLAINAEINSDNLNEQLQAFWEIERVEEASIEHSLEEEKFVKPNIKTLIIALKKDAMLYNYPLKRSILFR